MRRLSGLFLLRIVVAGACAGTAPPAGAAGPLPGRRTLSDSVRVIDASTPSVAVVRLSLQPGEWEAPLTVGLSLRMRSLDDLEARLARGDNLANGGLNRAELEARYLPAASDYAQVRSWAIGQGLAVSLDDPNHTTLFVRGTVAAMARIFGASFARVATPDGEFTSAVTAPSVPATLPASLFSIDGLQTHIRARRPARAAAAALGSAAAGFNLAPSDIRAAYGFPAEATGSGQRIAVIMSATVADSDLTQFWSTVGVTRSIGQYTVVPVDNGPGATEQSDFALEAAIDVDWASAMAPEAGLRLYAIPNLLFVTVQQACLQILSDAGSVAGLSVVSISIAGPENQLPISAYQSYSQTFAQLAAAGISVLACSGDGGSNPNPNLTNGYSASFALGPEYPASDPNVAGVGGTNLEFTPDWGKSGEVVWSTVPAGGGAPGATYLASGGGVSMFSRPAWQSDGGPVLSAHPDSRCVPDVAALSVGTGTAPGAAGTTYAAIVLHGQLMGCYGTSLATPIWAAIVALANEARAGKQMGPLGLLGPALYPLHGTDAFNDITSGSNGAYAAGPGYDLCTGLGTPNVSNLLAALTRPAPSGNPPVASLVAGAPASAVATGTPVSLSVGASGLGPFTYQWYLDGVALPGATAALYSVAAGAQDAGVYSVTVSGPGGSTTLGAGSLTVASHAWLTNLSARAYVEGGSNLLIAGFVTTGPSEKSILIRGAGPALAGLGVSGYLAHPELTLVGPQGTVLDSTSAWSSSLAPTFAALGAFPFAAASSDTALLETLPPDSFTAQVSPAQAGAGVAIVEVYDASASAPASRLINISARAFVGTGSDILIGGFAIAGTTSETVVVRGIGPALSLFGLTAVLSNPTLTVFDSTGKAIATDTGWQNAPTAEGAAAEQATANTFSRVSAFALPDASADCAVVLTLPPGEYTAQLAGNPGSTSPTGVGLIEVYELR
jgi:kumamolisin